jgi:tetratricopeptide (TPR) repeat protein
MAMSGIKKIFSAFGLIVFLGLAARAQVVPSDVFKKANAAYEQGNFAQARDLYEELVRAGQGSFQLYYNLGNAYYRLGRLGPARLWYERARRENSRDEDVRHNLNLVRSQIQEAAGDSFDLFEKIFPRVGWIFFISNIVFFGFLAAGLFSGNEWVWWGRWGSGLVFFLALGFFVFSRIQSRAPSGIVLEPRAEVRTGPGPDFRVGFVVPEGQKVVLFETINEWRQIGVPEKGLKGWVRQENVETISSF